MIDFIKRLLKAILSLVTVKPVKETIMATPYEIFIVDAIEKDILDVWDNQKYFITEELVPREIFQARKRRSIELFNSNAILTLIELRILADTPITVNTWHKATDGSGFQFRGYRPPYYYLNREIERYNQAKQDLSTLLGKLSKFYKLSQHTVFNAWDFDVRGYSAEDFRDKITIWKSEGKLKHLTGMEIDVPWVHVDCRLCERLDEDGLFKFKP